MKWYRDFGSGELVGDYPANCLPSSYGGKCVCPLCGQETVWWERQIDETELGEAVYGENLVCYSCGIGTVVQEIEGESDW